MSKPVKNMIIESYKKKFGGLDGALVIDIRGITSNQNNQLRAGLRAKKVRVSVVKNTLARKALAGSKLEKLTEVMEGPSALVYGGESVVSVARAIIAQVKENEKLQVKGAIMDGQIYGPKDIEALSKYPTKDEAIGQLVTLFLSPARKLAGQITGPGRKIAGFIKAIEQKLEKGEAIAKAG